MAEFNCHGAFLLCVDSTSSNLKHWRFNADANLKVYVESDGWLRENNGNVTLKQLCNLCLVL